MKSPGFPGAFFIHGALLDVRYEMVETGFYPTAHITSGPLVEAECGVPLPAFVIFLGMVNIEMQPPAFVAF